MCCPGPVVQTEETPEYARVYNSKEMVLSHPTNLRSSAASDGILNYERTAEESVNYC